MRLRNLVVACAAMAVCLGCAKPGPGLIFTIGGEVRDGLTGEGIEDAVVQMGGRTTLTDSDGSFLFEYDSGAEVTGRFLASKGVLFSFWGVEEVSLDPSENPRQTVYLDPQDYASYPTRTVTLDFLFAQGAHPSLAAFIANDRGGRDATGELGAATSFSTRTLGSDCIVVITYHDDSHPTPFTQYYRVDLAVDRIIDFDIEPTDSITVIGTDGDSFSCELDLASFNNVLNYAGGSIASGGSATLDLYNPDGYPIVWKNVAVAAASPSTGFTTYRMHLGPSMTSAGSVTLPARTALGPTGAVDAGEATWSASARTLSINMPASTTFIVLEFQDDNAWRGYYFTTVASLDFSGYFYDDTLFPGAGWDIKYRPVYADCTMEDVLGMRISGFGPCELSDAVVSFVVGNGTNDLSADQIP